MADPYDGYGGPRGNERDFSGGYSNTRGQGGSQDAYAYNQRGYGDNQSGYGDGDPYGGYPERYSDQYYDRAGYDAYPPSHREAAGYGDGPRDGYGMDASSRNGYGQGRPAVDPYGMREPVHSGRSDYRDAPVPSSVGGYPTGREQYDEYSARGLMAAGSASLEMTAQPQTSLASQPPAVVAEKPVAKSKIDLELEEAAREMEWLTEQKRLLAKLQQVQDAIDSVNAVSGETDTGSAVAKSSSSSDISEALPRPAVVIDYQAKENKPMVGEAMHEPKKPAQTKPASLTGEEASKADASDADPNSGIVTYSDSGGSDSEEEGIRPLHRSNTYVAPKQKSNDSFMDRRKNLPQPPVGNSKTGFRLPVLPHRPRKCRVQRWPGFQGYGFHLNSDRQSVDGHFIAGVVQYSPAEAAMVRPGDKLIEVNGNNVEYLLHEDLIQLVMQDPYEVTLLIVDLETEQYYAKADKSVHGAMEEIDSHDSLESAEAFKNKQMSEQSKESQDGDGDHHHRSVSQEPRSVSREPHSERGRGGRYSRDRSPVSGLASQLREETQHMHSERVRSRSRSRQRDRSPWSSRHRSPVRRDRSPMSRLRRSRSGSRDRQSPSRRRDRSRSDSRSRRVRQHSHERDSRSRASHDPASRKRNRSRSPERNVKWRRRGRSRSPHRDSRPRRHRSSSSDNDSVILVRSDKDPDYSGSRKMDALAKLKKEWQQDDRPHKGVKISQELFCDYEVALRHLRAIERTTYFEFSPGMRCPVCPTFCFDSAEIFGIHWRFLHIANVHYYKCLLCEQTFKRRPEAQEHCSRVHTAVFPPNPTQSDTGTGIDVGGTPFFHPRMAPNDAFCNPGQYHYVGPVYGGWDNGYVRQTGPSEKKSKLELSGEWRDWTYLDVLDHLLQIPQAFSKVQFVDAQLASTFKKEDAEGSDEVVMANAPWIKDDDLDDVSGDEHDGSAQKIKSAMRIKLPDRVYLTARYETDWIPENVDHAVVKEGSLKELVDEAIKWREPHRAYLLFSDGDILQAIPSANGGSEYVFAGKHQQVLSRLLMQIKEAVTRLFEADILPIFGDIVPIELDTYNFRLNLFTGTSYTKMQAEMNHMVFAANKIIAHYNSWIGVNGIDLNQEMIGKQSDGSPAFLFKYLADGFHPSSALKSFWQDALKMSMYLNRKKMDKQLGYDALDIEISDIFGQITWPHLSEDHVYASPRFDDSWLPRNIDCTIVQEGTLKALTNRAIARGKPHRAYLMFGDCDLITRKQRDGYTEVVFQGPPEEAVKRMVKAIKRAAICLLVHHIRPTFGDIVPVDLQAWNQNNHKLTGYPYMEMQQECNDSIVALNLFIRALNKDMKSGYIDLTSKIMNMDGGQCTVKYYFLSDGLHPVVPMGDVWKKNLSEAVGRNKANEGPEHVLPGFIFPSIKAHPLVENTLAASKSMSRQDKEKKPAEAPTNEMEKTSQDASRTDKAVDSEMRQIKKSWVSDDRILKGALLLNMHDVSYENCLNYLRDLKPTIYFDYAVDMRCPVCPTARYRRQLEFANHWRSAHVLFLGFMICWRCPFKTQHGKEMKLHQYKFHNDHQFSLQDTLKKDMMRGKMGNNSRYSDPGAFHYIGEIPGKWNSGWVKQTFGKDGLAMSLSKKLNKSEIMMHFLQIPQQFSLVRLDAHVLKHALESEPDVSPELALELAWSKDHQPVKGGKVAKGGVNYYDAALKYLRAKVTTTYFSFTPGMRCPACPTSKFTNCAEFGDHWRSRHMPFLGHISCKKCGFQTVHSNELITHYEEMHKAEFGLDEAFEPMYICDSIEMNEHYVYPGVFHYVGHIPGKWDSTFAQQIISSTGSPHMYLSTKFPYTKKEVIEHLKKIPQEISAVHFNSVTVGKGSEQHSSTLSQGVNLRKFLDPQIREAEFQKERASRRESDSRKETSNKRKEQVDSDDDAKRRSPVKVQKPALGDKNNDKGKIVVADSIVKAWHKDTRPHKGAKIQRDIVSDLQPLLGHLRKACPTTYFGFFKHMRCPACPTSTFGDSMLYILHWWGRHMPEIEQWTCMRCNERMESQASQNEHRHRKHDSAMTEFKLRVGPNNSYVDPGVYHFCRFVKNGYQSDLVRKRWNASKLEPAGEASDWSKQEIVKYLQSIPQVDSAVRFVDIDAEKEVEHNQSDAQGTPKKKKNSSALTAQQAKITAAFEQVDKKDEVSCIPLPGAGPQPPQPPSHVHPSTEMPPLPPDSPPPVTEAPPLPEMPPASGVPPFMDMSSGMPPVMTAPQVMHPPMGMPPGMASMHGMPPTEGLPPGMPPIQGLPPGMPPMHGMPPGMPPMHGMPPGMPPTHGMPPGIPSSQAMPPGMLPTHGMPPGIPSSQAMPLGMPPTQGLPPGMPPMHGMPPGIPSSQAQPPGMPPMHGMPPGIPSTQALPPGIPPTQGMPPGMPPRQGMPPQALPPGMPPTQRMPPGMPPGGYRWPPPRQAMPPAPYTQYGPPPSGMQPRQPVTQPPPWTPGQARQPWSTTQQRQVRPPEPGPPGIESRPAVSAPSQPADKLPERAESPVPEWLRSPTEENIPSQILKAIFVENRLIRSYQMCLRYLGEIKPTVYFNFKIGLVCPVCRAGRFSNAGLFGQHWRDEHLLEKTLFHYVGNIPAPWDNGVICRTSEESNVEVSPIFHAAIPGMKHEFVIKHLRSVPQLCSNVRFYPDDTHLSKDQAPAKPKTLAEARACGIRVLDKTETKLNECLVYLRPAQPTTYFSFELGMKCPVCDQDEEYSGESEYGKHWHEAHLTSWTDFHYVGTIPGTWDNGYASQLRNGMVKLSMSLAAMSSRWKPAQITKHLQSIKQRLSKVKFQINPLDASCPQIYVHETESEDPEAPASVMDIDHPDTKEYPKDIRLMVAKETTIQRCLRYLRPIQQTIYFNFKSGMRCPMCREDQTYSRVDMYGEHWCKEHVGSWQKYHYVGYMPGEWDNGYGCQTKDGTLRLSPSLSGGRWWTPQSIVDQLQSIPQVGSAVKFEVSQEELIVAAVIIHDNNSDSVEVGAQEQATTPNPVKRQSTEAASTSSLVKSGTEKVVDNRPFKGARILDTTETKLQRFLLYLCPVKPTTYFTFKVGMRCPICAGIQYSRIGTFGIHWRIEHLTAWHQFQYVGDIPGKWDTGYVKRDGCANEVTLSDSPRDVSKNWMSSQFVEYLKSIPQVESKVKFELDPSEAGPTDKADDAKDIKIVDTIETKLQRFLLYLRPVKPTTYFIFKVDMRCPICAGIQYSTLGGFGDHWRKKHLTAWHQFQYVGHIPGRWDNGYVKRDGSAKEVTLSDSPRDVSKNWTSSQFVEYLKSIPQVESNAKFELDPSELGRTDKAGDAKGLQILDTIETKLQRCLVYLRPVKPTTYFTFKVGMQCPICVGIQYSRIGSFGDHWRVKHLTAWHQFQYVGDIPGKWDNGYVKRDGSAKEVTLSDSPRDVSKNWTPSQFVEYLKSIPQVESNVKFELDPSETGPTDEAGDAKSSPMDTKTDVENGAAEAKTSADWTADPRPHKGAKILTILVRDHKLAFLYLRSAQKTTYFDHRPGMRCPVCPTDQMETRAQLHEHWMNMHVPMKEILQCAMCGAESSRIRWKQHSEQCFKNISSINQLLYIRKIVVNHAYVPSPVYHYCVELQNCSRTIRDADILLRALSFCREIPRTAEWSYEDFCNHLASITQVDSNVTFQLGDKVEAIIKQWIVAVMPKMSITDDTMFQKSILKAIENGMWAEDLGLIRPKCIVVSGLLNSETTGKDVLEVFAKYGDIVKLQFISGSSALIHYKKYGAATAALAEHVLQPKVGGSPVSVRMLAMKDVRTRPSSSLIVERLPVPFSNIKLMNLFKKFGQLVRFQNNEDGSGSVELKDPQFAAKARIRMEGYLVQGQEISIRFKPEPESGASDSSAAGQDNSAPAQ